MIETNQAIVLWKRCLNIIKDNVQATAFDMWFKPIVPLKFENKTLTIGVPSPFFYEYLEEHFVDILREVIYKEFGEGTALMYSIMTDKTNGLEQNFSGGNTSHPSAPIVNANKAPMPPTTPTQELDPHLNPKYSFENFIKGSSNEFSRTVAETVAENPAPNSS